MENQNQIIRQFQEVIDLEFNKKFDIKVNNRNYTVAFPIDEIPVVRALNKDGCTIIIFFSSPEKHFQVNQNKIFHLLEKEPGNFEAVIVNLNNRYNTTNRFKIGREVVEEINENELNDNEIVNTKRKYLVHAIYDVLCSAKENFWNIDFGNHPKLDDTSCISAK